MDLLELAPLFSSPDISGDLWTASVVALFGRCLGLFYNQLFGNACRESMTTRDYVQPDQLIKEQEYACLLSVHLVWKTSCLG